MTKILFPFYRWLVFAPFLLVSTSVFGALAIMLSNISGELASRIAGRGWGKANVIASLSGVQVIGGQHIKANQSYVVVANHLSDFDILAVYGWLDLDIKWVMKKELRKVPIIGYSCEAMGFFFIDRSDHAQAMATLEDCKRKMKPGVSVMVFPEGTRSRTAKLAHFKSGAFLLAKDLNLPILPLTIVGSDKVLPADTLNLYPGEIQLIIGEPIPAETVMQSSHRDLAELARERVRERLPAYNY